ncbi:MAG: sigma-70 family RNA polymerase sigma factor [Bacteroidetes bacterium]|nr:sigma-70 family RNA polymerase sigma factor [Bacteroidota bacterium]
MSVINATNDFDQHLLKGILAADNQSIRRVYDLALPSVITWVVKNSGTEADARDIYQDALMALFRKLESSDFTLTCTLKSFLRIMCRNLWLTKLRDAKKYQAAPLENVEEVSLEKDMVAQLEQSERSRLFFKHFDGLGENCRKILSLFFDKIPLADIAKQMDTSENYIKKRKFQCKEQLINAVQSDPIFLELKS